MTGASLVFNSNEVLLLRLDSNGSMDIHSAVAD
ncbi:MAG: hypothetical protein IPP34_08170 [Bacteroidetes bacterium]|nr:hypothetical protein [Bacteroidota bacterium]